MTGDLPADRLPAATEARIQSLAAEGRAQIETAMRRGRARGNRTRIALLRTVGAIAIGTVAAGISILGTVIVLNLVFHYIPT
jgi:hypothetical protein